MAGREYYTLMASLPALPYFERAHELPINAVRLQKSMTMLEPCDLEIVTKIIQFISWDVQPMERTDREVLAHYEEIERLTRHSPVLWKIVETEMNNRSILVALRRRKMGLGPPAKHEVWGVGTWLDHIARNWNQPDFAMGMVFSWLAKGLEYFQKGQALELQRLLMRENWRMLDAVYQENPFSFEAAVAYIFKWGITHMWLLNNHEAAGERFNSLILEVTRGQEQLFNA